MKALTIKRSSVATLSQIPLCLRGMMQRAKERAKRRERNRAFVRSFFGQEKHKTNTARLSENETVESNLALR